VTGECFTLSRVTQPTVVISGAGVAGPSLAHWLSVKGYRVVVVEAASGVRPDGVGRDRIRKALGRYETVMRPYVDRCQDLPQGIDGFMPKSASDIAITALVMKWMQRRPFRSFAEKTWFTTADAISLPDYPSRY
jgi:choline dehydrogenase-like flavoprotein